MNLSLYYGPIGSAQRLTCTNVGPHTISDEELTTVLLRQAPVGASPYSVNLPLLGDGPLRRNSYVHELHSGG